MTNYIELKVQHIYNMCIHVHVADELQFDPAVIGPAIG